MTRVPEIIDLMSTDEDDVVELVERQVINVDLMATEEVINVDLMDTEDEDEVEDEDDGEELTINEDEDSEELRVGTNRRNRASSESHDFVEEEKVEESRNREQGMGPNERDRDRDRDVEEEKEEEMQAKVYENLRATALPLFVPKVTATPTEEEYDPDLDYHPGMLSSPRVDPIPHLDRNARALYTQRRSEEYQSRQGPVTPIQSSSSILTANVHGDTAPSGFTTAQGHAQEVTIQQLKKDQSQSRKDDDEGDAEDASPKKTKFLQNARNFVSSLGETVKNGGIDLKKQVAKAIHLKKKGTAPVFDDEIKLASRSPSNWKAFSLDDNKDTVFNQEYTKVLISIGQSEEDGAQDDKDWNEETDFVENVPEEVEESIPPHLERFMDKTSEAKDTWKYVKLHPSTGKISYSLDILTVFAMFQGGGEGWDYSLFDQGDEDKKRSHDLTLLVFETMVSQCPFLLTDSYCDVLNVSRPCWYAQLFFLFLGEYVASGHIIDYDTFRKKMEFFYKEVFPRFHCKGKGEYQGKTPIYFRDPRSLYETDGLEAKKINALIREIAHLLPYLAKKDNPMKFIQEKIVTPMLTAFGLNRDDLEHTFQNKIVMYIILNRIVEQLHWFYKDLLTGLLLAGMRPLLALRLLLKQEYFWAGVDTTQQKRLVNIGIQHSRKSNKSGGYSIWVGKKNVPSQVVFDYITTIGVIIPTSKGYTAAKNKRWNECLEELKAYVQTREINDPIMPFYLKTDSLTGEKVPNKLEAWVRFQKFTYKPIYERIQSGEKVSLTCKQRVKMLTGIEGWTFGELKRDYGAVPLIEYSLHDGEKIRTYNNVSEIVSTTTGKQLSGGSISQLVNGTCDKKGNYVVQVDGRVFRKAKNVPLTQEQKLMDQMITEMLERKGNKHIFFYCRKKDVEDNDPDKYKWWNISEFTKEFNLTRYYVDGQLKKYGFICIDGTLYKKSPMYYIPKY